MPLDEFFAGPGRTVLAPGEIVDLSGRVVGRHQGVIGYTVGQRRGLRLGRPAPDGKPRYVLGVSPVDRRAARRPAGALSVDGGVGLPPRGGGTAPTRGGEYLAP